ncbi:sensor histidine kinase, partial [Acinetobacter baumannii]
TERDNVFARFYRLDSAVNPAGSGLGLSIVKEIADRHQAVISLTERDTTTGCRFSVKFKPYAKN